LDRTVLAVNHCFDVIVKRFNGKNWKDAFLEAIPKRKID